MRKRRHTGVWRVAMLIAAVPPMLGSTCSGLDYLFGTLPDPNASPTELTLAVTAVQPSGATTAAPGATTLIQWADIAETSGTVVRVSAVRIDSEGEVLDEPIHLIGDGTVGSGRDAVADGDNDIFNWDITGVRVGSYNIHITIEAPDGTTESVRSRDDDRGTTGVITITTPLPVPTLTFTAPGATDETVNEGTTFDITWTDNGTANADAMLTLGLDTDNDHDSGNEIILTSNQPLSQNDDTGQFTFSFVDEDGDAVSNDTYTVFASLDDSVNQIVTVGATGHLILEP